MIDPVPFSRAPKPVPVPDLGMVHTYPCGIDYSLFGAARARQTEYIAQMNTTMIRNYIPPPLPLSRSPGLPRLRVKLGRHTV